MPPKSSSTTQTKFEDLVSLSTAVTLVSYSRDYIGRLAREGKIFARQIDKQWFVSRESLLNFFEHSLVEDSAKKRILSLSRKNDLEVKDFYKTAVAKITARQTSLGNTSLFATVLIVAGGLCSGLLLHTQAVLFTNTGNAQLAQIFSALQLSSTEAAVGKINLPATVFSDAVVLETQDKIPMDGGVILFPTVNQENKESVEQLFSDDITVVITSTTTGFVRFEDGDRELPFVRIPDTTD